jgi:hypothetical protein
VILEFMLAVTLWQTDHLTATQVRDSYREFFSLNFPQYQNQWGASAGVDTLPSGHPLAGFVKERKMYLMYLAQASMPTSRMVILVDRHFAIPCASNFTSVYKRTRPTTA